MLLAFVAVTAVLGASRLRGFIALVMGLTIGLIGIDAVSGQPRLTFGIAQLGDGIDVVVVAVGIFALGEALWVAAHLRRQAAEIIPVGQPFMGRQDWKRSWKPWLRGTAFGFPFGVIPAGGAEIPTFLSYITEKKLTKHPEEFGKGAIEGVAGPEAANNASAAGTMVPMLALGLPTNATAAVHARRLDLVRHPARAAAAATRERAGLGADRQPVHRQHPAAADLEPAAGAGRGRSCSGSPGPTCTPASCSSPRWARTRSTVHLRPDPAARTRLLGFAMRRFGIPVLPLIVGVILGPRVELQGRRAMQLSSGDPKGLFGSVDVATGQFVVSAIAVMVYMIILHRADLAAGVPADQASTIRTADRSTTKDSATTGGNPQ